MPNLTAHTLRLVQRTGGLAGALAHGTNGTSKAIRVAMWVGRRAAREFKARLYGTLMLVLGNCNWTSNRLSQR